MRSYIRHPTDVPIELSPAEWASDDHLRIKDVSIGGLSLKSATALELKALIKIKIPLVEPPFETHGKVVWCRKNSLSDYEVGVEFIDEQDAYAARMVEQICHIEHYRNNVKETDGRDLNIEEAAQEWIKKYARDFPSFEHPQNETIN
ncbi:PilZ domain-containing protein [Alkalimarinus alittae]|uniref:PilZ domain-containing protein n=1 Tax=Alkalimarinus alittae TaxID=2961619 RepID=A0ABY6MZA5_9ALTE|nr:PilZ domain-containing protein [Alkalimarinus alittae]UZE95176.1 PilZ domain-containing protein [Alkalimarinus alittae]